MPVQMLKIFPTPPYRQCTVTCRYWSLGHPPTWKLFHCLFWSLNGPFHRNVAQESYYSSKIRESRFPGADQPTAAKFNRIALKTESALSYSPTDAIPWQFFQQVKSYRFWTEFRSNSASSANAANIDQWIYPVTKPSFMISRNKCYSKSPLTSRSAT